MYKQAGFVEERCAITFAIKKKKKKIQMANDKI